MPSGNWHEDIIGLIQVIDVPLRGTAFFENPLRFFYLSMARGLAFGRDILVQGVLGEILERGPPIILIGESGELSLSVKAFEKSSGGGQIDEAVLRGLPLVIDLPRRSIFRIRTNQQGVAENDGTFRIAGGGVLDIRQPCFSPFFERTG